MSVRQCRAGKRTTALRVLLKRWLGRDWATAYVFVLPTIVLLGGLIAYPFLNAVYLSFTNTVTLHTGPWVGLTQLSELSGKTLPSANPCATPSSIPCRRSSSNSGWGCWRR